MKKYFPRLRTSLSAKKNKTRIPLPLLVKIAFCSCNNYLEKESKSKIYSSLQENFDQFEMENQISEGRKQPDIFNKTNFSIWNRLFILALNLISTAIEKAGYTGKIDIGMDVAASEFFR